MTLMTGMKVDDIIYILEHQKILRKDSGVLNCDKEFLEQLLKASGRPVKPVDMKEVRWKPFITNTELNGG